MEESKGSPRDGSAAIEAQKIVQKEDKDKEDFRKLKDEFETTIKKLVNKGDAVAKFTTEVGGWSGAAWGGVSDGAVDLCPQHLALVHGATQHTARCNPTQRN